MRHGDKINNLSRTASHRRALLSNLACQLIAHKRIVTTVAKAKALRVYVEPLITKGKDNTTHQHRVVFSYLQDKEAVKELFSTVAEKVAGALKATLIPEEAARVASVPTQNAEAYDLYLRALAYSNRANDQYALTRVVMPQAIELLQQVIAKDPKFALAAALLARAHMYMYFFGPDRSDTRLKAAKVAIDQALAEQPDLGEAHFAFSFYWYWGFRESAGTVLRTAGQRLLVSEDRPDLRQRS